MNDDKVRDYFGLDPSENVLPEYRRHLMNMEKKQWEVDHADDISAGWKESIFDRFGGHNVRLK